MPARLLGHCLVSWGHEPRHFNPRLPPTFSFLGKYRQ